MSKEEILQRIIDAIVAGDTPAVEAATQEGLDSGIAPEALIDEGGAKGMEIVGEKFENLEMFIPELLIAAETMRALNKLVFPHLNREERGEVVGVAIGTVAGDTHDLGLRHYSPNPLGDCLTCLSGRNGTLKRIRCDNDFHDSRVQIQGSRFKVAFNHEDHEDISSGQ